MRAELGFALLTIGTVGALLGVATLATGIITKRPRLLDIGRRYVVVVLVRGGRRVRRHGDGAVRARLLVAVRRRQRRARDAGPVHVHRRVVGARRLDPVVGARCSRSTSRSRRGASAARATDPIVAWATLVQLGVLLFFFALMLFAANPFKEVSGAIPLDGRGPEPAAAEPSARRDPPADALRGLRRLHDPVLVRDRRARDRPVRRRLARRRAAHDARRVGFLTVGIVLGAWWSYAVLGWGGYWGWDPVENASLLPWLTATAFIHSVMVQERRGMLRVWNLSLVISTFCLTILGTFLTRSGVVNSVHAFSESSIGPWLLIFLGCLRVRRRRARSRGGATSCARRAGSTRRCRVKPRSCSTTCCSPAFALVVLTGTVFPLLVEALQDKQVTVGRALLRAARGADRARVAVPHGGRPGACRGAPRRGELLRHRLLDSRVGGRRSRSSSRCSRARTASPTCSRSRSAAFTLASIGRSMTLGVRARAARRRTKRCRRRRCERCAATRASTAACSCTSGSS